MLNEDMPKILETYYGATQIPIFYIDEFDHLLLRFPESMDKQALIDFFDFGEVLEFAGSFFTCNDNSFPNPCHIFHTRHFFIYTIIILNVCQSTTGAIISGPVSVYPPDERRIDELLSQNKMPAYRKPEMKLLLSFLPSIPVERMQHYSKLLSALCESDMKSMAFPEPEVHNNWMQLKPISKTLSNLTKGRDLNKLEKSYRFLLNIRNKMIHGDTEGIEELLKNSVDILLDIGSSKDTFIALKNRYLILCTTLHIFSIQSKAPYIHMVNILDQLTKDIELLNTSSDILSAMISAIRIHARAVSTLTKNLYSLHVNQALQYIRNHYTEGITLEILAEHARINPIYLSSLIKKETGLSLSDNINKFRIEESYNLLTYTDKSISDIAFAVGYGYQNHFCRVFKKFTGMTPLEFKKIHKYMNIGEDHSTMFK